MSALDELLNSIFDGKKSAFAAEFESWLRSSRRFKAFATSYHSKIRTKLKNVRDEGGMKDLRAELQTAVLLLREERFSLEYEKFAASKRRSPDFTVTFKTHTPFNVEVRRIRSLELSAENPEAHLIKLTAALCDKIGQTQPSMMNLLWLIDEASLSEADLTLAINGLLQLAQNKVEDFFRKYHYESATDFLKHYRQLSGIVLQQNGENRIWQNSQARHKLPSEIVNAILRLES
jgi:hypothetical protein